jgi:hypothetical protein
VLELTVPVEPDEPDEVPDEFDPDELEPEPDEEPEFDEPLDPLPPPPLPPPSGSTYCWSPADGPLASAATGASIPTANTTSSERSVIRRKVTLRVLQAVRLLAFSDRRTARRLVELAASAGVVIGAVMCWPNGIDVAP